MLFLKRPLILKTLPGFSVWMFLQLQVWLSPPGGLTYCFPLHAARSGLFRCHTIVKAVSSEKSEWHRCRDGGRKAKRNMVVFIRLFRKQMENSQPKPAQGFESHCTKLENRNAKTHTHTYTAWCLLPRTPEKENTQGISVTCRGNIILMQSDANSKDRHYSS